MGRCLLALLLILLTSCVAGRDERRDPQTGRIRVLYIGDAWGPTPFFHISAEPSFIASPIPATYQHIGTYGDRQLRQFMRIYMPRSYGELVSKYDSVILSDTNRGLYSVEQLIWFRESVEDEGLGLMMVGGVEAFGGDNHPTWGDSPVEEALPVLCMSGKTFRKDFKAIPYKPEDSFIKSLPWKTMPFFHGMNIVTAKDGSSILLQADLDPHHPILVHWTFGEGAGLAHAPDWTPAWGQSIMYDWEYYSDYVANMLYLVGGVQIPQDPELIHQIRKKFMGYALDRAFAISLIEFVEKFGAQISKPERSLQEIASMQRQAERSYVEQDYEAVLSKLDAVKERFDSLTKELLKLKDRALLWIYVVEWSVVSATSIICGVLVWALMVRKRLYREVQLTRSRL